MRQKLQSLKFLPFFLCFLAVSQSSYYNITLECDTCTSTTGCTSNLCLKMAGDLNAEVCYGASSCGFTGTSAAKIGRCSFSVNGACSSGLCLDASSVNLCYSTNYCFTGTTASSTCSNSVLTTTYSGGSFSLPSPTTTNLDVYMSYCYFSSVTQTWSSCSGDIYGGSSCSCCSQTTYSGMTVDMGSCVSENSNIYQVKSSVPESSQTFLRVMCLFSVLIAFLI